MNRRSLLKLANVVVASLCAAVVGIPGVHYLIETANRREKKGEASTQRLIRLKDLQVGRPKQLPVTGRRRDAWMVYEKETIGLVWLVRQAGAKEPAVTAYSTVCPHLGCAVKLDTSGKTFVCPCHKAAWDLKGGKVGDKQLGHKNPSPRGLDVLDCQVVTDEETGEQWVEVKYEKFQPGLAVKKALA